MVLIQQDHHPQRPRLPHQANKQAQRQRPHGPCSSSECPWDLQLVGYPCVRLLRREDLHLILGERDPACYRARQSPSRGRERGPAILSGPDSSDGGVRPFGPVLAATTEGWRARPWPFTPRSEQAISFRGPVAEEASNLCYTSGVAKTEEHVEKALMASSSVAVTSEDSVSSPSLPSWHRRNLCHRENQRRLKGERRPKQRHRRRPPCRLQQEGGPLCATIGFIGPTSSHGVLPWS